MGERVPEPHGADAGREAARAHGHGPQAVHELGRDARAPRAHVDGDLDVFRDHGGSTHARCRMQQGGLVLVEGGAVRGYEAGVRFSLALVVAPAVAQQRPLAPRADEGGGCCSGVVGHGVGQERSQAEAQVLEVRGGSRCEEREGDGLFDDDVLEMFTGEHGTRNESEMGEDEPQKSLARWAAVKEREGREEGQVRALLRGEARHLAEGGVEQVARAESARQFVVWDLDLLVLLARRLEEPLLLAGGSPRGVGVDEEGSRAAREVPARGQILRGISERVVAMRAAGVGFEVVGHGMAPRERREEVSTSAEGFHHGTEGGAHVGVDQAGRLVSRGVAGEEAATLLRGRWHPFCRCRRKVEEISPNL